jgi:CheY-like chemotaxis protein
LSSRRSVLIVDSSAETREVLQTVLERQGVRTLSADRATRGVELAQRHRPDLIVLDMELEDMPVERFSDGLPTAEMAEKSASSPDSATASFGASAPSYQPQMVLLGSLRDYRQKPAGGEFVAKPYHYAPLIRKIEELLRNSPEHGPCRRCSSSAEPIKAAALT